MFQPHLEILDSKRLGIFKKLKLFASDFVLIGGTAVSLQIAHRKSFDFDLSAQKPLRSDFLIQVNQNLSDYKITPLVDNSNELSVLLDQEVKLSFVYFPFGFLHKLVQTDFIFLASLKDLASNKAYTIGRRGEWKDYVDLYFLLTKGRLNIGQIIFESEKRFQGAFNPKLFWQQLVYWEDLNDFSIEYFGGKVKKETIQDFYSKLVKQKIGF